MIRAKNGAQDITFKHDRIASVAGKYGEARVDPGKAGITMKHELKAATSPSWFVVDKEGLRKTLSRKGKAFAIYELLQNAYDEASTKVEVTLAAPKNGRSVLTCTDNSPNGYADLSQAHTMFAESKKKSDEKKRGRFNVGEKHVLALCDSASITSTTGRTVFVANGKRKHDSVKTRVGTQFHGILPLTQEEYNDIVKQVRLVIPPIPTKFNGKLLPTRKILHEFTTKLPTEIADENGVLRSRVRSTTVRLYESKTPMLYELGMPVVSIDCKWSADIQQKVPLNIERDNVTPSYLKAVLGAIVNEKGDDISDDEASAAWVSTAMESKAVKPEALKKVFTKRFGEGAVLYDHTDIGSNKEAVAAGRQVIPRGAVTAQVRKSLKEAGVKTAGEEFSTRSSGAKNIIPDKQLTKDQKQYKQFIEAVSPLVLKHPLKKVQFADDPNAKLYGCTQWLDPKGYVFTVNVAKHDVSNWKENYDLLIHELAHFYVQRNDHLFAGFWAACSNIGAKLANAALTHPKLFPKPFNNFANDDDLGLPEDEEEAA